MSELKLPRLLAAAKEFNIGQDTLVEFLVGIGFNRDELKPTAKLSEEMYRALLQKYQSDKVAKNKADLIEIPKVQSERKRRDEEEISYRREERKVEPAILVIEKCINTKDVELDLGNCGLTDKDFEKDGYINNLLRVCNHIKTFILSTRWNDYSSNKIIYSKNKHKENRIYEVPECLNYFVQLETLILCGTSEKKWGIKETSFLNNLKNLNYANLSFNTIKTIDSLEHSSLRILELNDNTIERITENNSLSSLELLNLSNNQISTIAGINNFKKLEILRLNDNQFDDINILHGLSNLVLLDLANNKLNEIKGLSTSTQLKQLYLGGNKISNIQGLEELSSLTWLSLSNNMISELKGLSSLIELNSLFLNNNFIEKFDGNLSNLKKLEILQIDNNKVDDLHGIEELDSLTNLFVENNQLKYVDDLLPLLSLQRLHNVFLEGNELLDEIPEEVISAGWAAIKDRIAGGSLQDFKEVKVLLLGNPNVGKSNLLEYLETRKTPILDTPTFGIQYKKLEKAVKGFKIHCWDFGGQEYFHATHQLFFSPGGLHIILWSSPDVSRDSNKIDECFTLPYWIRCVEQLIPTDTRNNIEVIIVENKIDKNNFRATPINQLSYTEKYPDLNFNFTNFSLKPLTRISSFEELFKERVEALCKKHPSIYFKYYKKIEQSTSDFIEISDIADKDFAKVKTAMTVFHNMGILLYFPEIIAEKVFIKPQALLDLLYKKILNEKKKFEISRLEIENAVEQNEFGISAGEVIDLLKYFDLVFQIPNFSNTYFVPQYLQSPPTIINFFEQHQFQKANIIIESDRFLMNVAMLKIFSKFGRYVQGKNSKECLFWKDGIIIEKDNSMLMIKFDRSKQKIELYPDVRGSNFLLQKNVVDFILNIPINKNKLGANLTEQTEETNNDINWRSDDFVVFCSVDNCFFVKWNELIYHRENNIFQVEVCTYDNRNLDNSPKKSKVVSIFDFNEYLPKNQRGEKKNIFISYSKEDVKLVNKFIEHLSALKLDGKIATWYCSELTGGSDWNYEIQDHFDRAHIVCFMISPNFMKTNYIQEYEVKKAFERRTKDSQFKIIPIILDFCRWNTLNNNLGTFTALPYTGKPVVDFENQNKAWYIIEECLRVIIDEDSNLEGENLYTNPKLPKDVLYIYEDITDKKVNKNS